MGFFGVSSAISGAAQITAQELANQANLDIARMTNENQYKIAQEANDLNYKMFNEQNTWNLQQWERENEYNSPSAQYERYAKAGLNPLWAIGNGNPGNAQQLTSAPFPGAEVAQLQMPQVQAPDLSFLSSVATDVMNSKLGFERLAMEQKRTDSEVDKMKADTSLIEAQTEAQRWANNITIDTYGSQVIAKSMELTKLSEEIDNTKEDTKLKHAQRLKEKALKEQVTAATAQTEAQTMDIIDGISRAWRMISISQQQANTAQQQANTSQQLADIAQQRVDLDDKRLNFDIQNAENDFSLKSNEQILKLVELSMSDWDKKIGNPGNVISDLVSGKDSGVNRLLDTLKSASKELYKRFYSNPTKTNAEYINRLQKNVQLLQQKVPSFYNFGNPIDSTNSSVLNPSSSWSQ